MRMGEVGRSWVLMLKLTEFDCCPCCVTLSSTFNVTSHSKTSLQSNSFLQRFNPSYPNKSLSNNSNENFSEHQASHHHHHQEPRLSAPATPADKEDHKIEASNNCCINCAPSSQRSSSSSMIALKLLRFTVVLPINPRRKLACPLVDSALQRSLRLSIGEGREIEVVSGIFKEPGRDVS